MKAVVQRVKNASVTVNAIIEGQIDNGILVYVGFDIHDTSMDIKWMINKIKKLRIFLDDNNKMNLSVQDLNYDILVISQFTLLGNCKKGLRPSFDRAAKPDYAKKLYDEFVQEISKFDIKIETGVFQAHMEVEYTNDGPITIILDSKD